MARRMRSLVAAAFAAACGLAVMAGAASADWRSDIKVLRVGIAAGANPAYRIRQVEPFRKYLETRLGIPVEIVPATNYLSLIDAQSSGNVSYAVYSASAFASADALCHCVEPLVQPRGPNQAAGYYSIVIVKATGPINNLADAKGARLSYTRGPSIAGHLLPFSAFTAEGTPAERLFGALVPADDAEGAVRTLLRGDADAAIAWASLSGDVAEGYDRGILRKLVADGSLAMSDIRIVWKSPLIPYGPHAVRTDLPDDLKLLLRDALLAMPDGDPQAYDAIERDAGGGFVEPAAGAYDAVKRMIATPVVDP
jgi:phosphonate transport system substrate-binding protein